MSRRMNSSSLTFNPSYSMGLNAPYERRPYQQSYNTVDWPNEPNEPNQPNQRDLLNELRDISDSPSTNSSSRLYSTLDSLNSGSTTAGASEQVLEMFPPPQKRYCPVDKRPVYKGDTYIPRQDALLVEMIIQDKATLKAQLDITKHAIVGLDYVTEYIDPECPIRIYECSICKTFRTVNSIMEHITGYNHKQKRFPSEVKMFLLPDGKNKNRNKALMSVATQRCGELELVYGRGEFQTKHEKAKMPDGALEAPESDMIVDEDDKGLEWMKKILKNVINVKIENDEGVRLAKQITSHLTNAICEYKFNNKTEPV